MATANHSTSPDGDNPTQELEQLKRKFRQYLRLRDKLKDELIVANLNRRHTKTASQTVKWQLRIYQLSRYEMVVERAIERLTAPAGGAE